jgi:site-specific DNA recombinase
MVCGKCGAAITQVSGKAGGYYGCIGATKGACDNKLLVRRNLVEKIILDAVREQLSDPQDIEYVLKRVEVEVGKLYTHVPESIHLKEIELTAEERRLANFVDFIGEGRGSRTLAQALFESERKVQALNEELESLHRCRSKVFQVPPIEWIQERLTKLKDILERNSERSGLLLRKLLGPLRLEPTCADDTDQPFYKATTSLPSEQALQRKSHFTAQHGLPFIASHPSRKINGTRPRAASGSAHSTPQIALTMRPDKAIKAR